MVSQRLRQVMLAAVGAGRLAGEGIRHGCASHPVCGDEVDLQLRCRGDAIAELAWQARGCPATMAVVALAGQVLPGQPLAGAAEALRAALAAHGGLAAAERHAEALFLRALHAAAAAET
jgi:nitrogen fixation NifU-like protein